MMFDKVYCVYDHYDMTFINGVADYNNSKFYFECIFSDNDDYGQILIN
jgi:hypothetical protein